MVISLANVDQLCIYEEDDNGGGVGNGERNWKGNSREWRKDAKGEEGRGSILSILPSLCNDNDMGVCNVLIFDVEDRTVLLSSKKIRLILSSFLNWSPQFGLDCYKLLW